MGTFILVFIGLAVLAFLVIEVLTLIARFWWLILLVFLALWVTGFLKIGLAIGNFLF